MKTDFYKKLSEETEALKENKLYKKERELSSPQQAEITVADGKKGGTKVLNFCANNYLGLANHPALIEAAQETLARYGFGMSSVRFICGTQTIHKQLEEQLSDFLGMEESLLYSSCFDANGGLFETLFSEEDAIISDELNHASIIDGVRLCKAVRYKYKNNDMADLEVKLQSAEKHRYRVIATDGVFSMDGIVANLKAICDLADKYDALVMVDDSHAVGFMGEKGRGTPEHCGVMGRVDILTGTLGKAMGGASGGYTSARKEIITWLRQRSRPYLFSNTVAPVVVGTSLKVLEVLKKEGDGLRKKLCENSARFREQMLEAGFNLAGRDHPIIPVMLGDAKLAGDMADRLLKEGIYVIGFSFPVVPHGGARIRTQISAAHTSAQIDKAVAAFAKVGRELGVIK
jgi:glycine C-acetyltransferase